MQHPSSPFHTWEWIRARTLGLFIQWSWWRAIRQSSTHSCFALFLEARRNSTQFSALLIAAATHCDEWTHDRKAASDNRPLSHYQLVTLHSHLSHVGSTAVQGKIQFQWTTAGFEFCNLRFRWIWLSGWCYSFFCARYRWVLPVCWDLYIWNLLQHWGKLHLLVSWRFPALCFWAHMSR